MTAVPKHVVTAASGGCSEEIKDALHDGWDTNIAGFPGSQKQRLEGEDDRWDNSAKIAAALLQLPQLKLPAQPRRQETDSQTVLQTPSPSLSYSGDQGGQEGQLYIADEPSFGTMPFTPVSAFSRVDEDDVLPHHSEAEKTTHDLERPSSMDSHDSVHATSLFQPELLSQRELQGVKNDEAVAEERKDGSKLISKSLLPPSPPPTRDGTVDGSHQFRGSEEDYDVLNNVEGQGHDQRTSAPDQAEDLRIEEHAPADNSYESEKSFDRRSGNVPFTIQPPSPQPWDFTELPERTADKSEHYSTLGSKNFSTMQSKSTARKLVPQSTYYFGPPPPDSAFGTEPVGQIGLHYPREIIRVERDYSGGELIQFAPIFPMELDGRISPTQFLESINAINELLISAHSLRRSLVDNLLAVVTLQLSRLFVTSHFDKEMRRLERLFELLNVETYNPAGLNLVWPRQVAFLYLEIEYYVSVSGFTLPYERSYNIPQ